MLLPCSSALSCELGNSGSIPTSLFVLVPGMLELPKLSNGIFIIEGKGERGWTSELLF